MLTELLHWLWIAAVSLGGGSLLGPALARLASASEQGPLASDFERLSLQSVLGLGVLAVGGMILNFFVPLGSYTALSLGLTAIAVGIGQGAYRGLWRLFAGWSLPARLLFAATAFFLLAKAAAPSGYFDLGLYYIQTIRWAERYPIVPGLANLHTRLGFNSTWHQLTALLNPVADRVTLDGVNEYLLTLALGYFAFGRLGRRGVAPARRVMAWAALAVTLAFLVEFVTAPAADLAVLVLVWLMADLLLDAPADRPAAAAQVLLALTLAAFAFTVKHSALAALGIVGLTALARGQAGLLLRYAWVPVLFIGLWMGRSYVLSGYPLFLAPLPLPAALVPGWQVPQDQVQLASDDIRGFARLHLNTAALHARYTYGQLARMPLREWLPLWFGQKTVLELLFLLVEAVALIDVLIAAARRRLERGQLGMAAALVLGLAFWFVSAPAVRFGFAYIVPLCGLAAVAWLRRGDKAPRPGRLGWMTPALLAVFVAGFALRTLDLRVFRQYMLVAAPWPTVPTGLSEDGTYYYVTTPLEDDYTQCWDAAQPCAESSTHRLKRRGSRLEDGFESRPGSR